MPIVSDYKLKNEIIDALIKGYKTIDDIYNYLSGKYSKAEIKSSLSSLLVEDEKIVRNDFYYNDSSYELVDRKREKSNYTKHYRSFIDDNPSKKKKILLISDTHIGNSSLENMNLINSIYEYGKENSCDCVFHQGDLFEGKSNNEVETFINNYPHLLRTICLTGNHDKSFNNLKGLNNYNDLFNTYEVDNWSTSLNNISTHLSHRLYISWILDDKRINSINELDGIEEWISNDYKLLISGHLHQGIIYSNKNYLNNYILYLGVPSLSNMNIGKAIAYIIEIDENNINIKVLSTNNKSEIKEIDNIDIDCNKNNKQLKKVY